MPRTHGHGNPSWTRDETILALNLYFACDERVPPNTDPRIRELSDLLRRLPIHAGTWKTASFRNPDSVCFKLQNIRQVATGRGLENVSRTDRQVWAELSGNKERVKHLAELIGKAVEVTENTDSYEVDDEFAEGSFVTAAHQIRERDPRLRRKLILSRLKQGPLSCELCDGESWSSDPELNGSIFEGHHIVPLSMSTTSTTKVSDMALLCANCHRLLHRLISRERRWIRIKEARKMCGLVRETSRI
jgi:5-methylcytosine-specific restriction enzyme A